MEHKPQPYYPVFEANQVLTNTHLNELRNYLDQQIRYSRIDLSGIGIISGLTFSLHAEPLKKDWASFLIVKEGVGISSEGYLMRYKGEFKGNNYFLDPPPSLQDDDFDEVSFSKYVGYRDYPDPSADFYWYNGNEDTPVPPAPGEVIQLLTEAEWDEVEAAIDPDNPVPPPPYLPATSNALFDNKVVVLYLEVDDESLKSCVSKDCDNKGLKRNFNLRVLLVKKDLVKNFEGSVCSPSITSVLVDENLKPYTEKVTYANYVPRPLALKRFVSGLPAPGVPVAPRLSSINNYNDIKVAYNNTFGTTPADIVKKLDYYYDNFGGFLGLLGYGKAELPTLNGAGWKVDATIQYSHDFIKELTKATNEFEALAREIIHDCYIEDYRFCRHLMLGLLEPSGAISAGNYEKYRNYFLQCPLTEAQDRKMRKAQLFFARILLMIKGFDPATTVTVSDPSSVLPLIPSQEDEYTLGKGTIPDYYNKASNVKDLVKYWDPDRSLIGRYMDTLSFHAATYVDVPPDAVLNPLNYNVDEYPFFRVANVLGLDYTQVLRAFENSAKVNGLPVKIKALQLGNTVADSVIDFDCYFKAEQMDYLLVREELACAITTFYAFIRDNQNRIFPMDNLPNFRTGINLETFHYSKLLALLNSLKPTKLVDFVMQDHNLGIYQNLNSWYRAFQELYRDARDWAGYLMVIADYKLDVLNRKPFSVCAQPTDRELAQFLESMKAAMNQFLSACGFAKMMVLAHSFLFKLDLLKSGYPGIFKNFAWHHPGMEHKGGVAPGGTFIVVYQDDANANNKKVLADFSLPYQCCDGCEDPVIPPGTKTVASLPPVARFDWATTTPGVGVNVMVTYNDFNPAVGAFENSVNPTITITNVQIVRQPAGGIGGSVTPIPVPLPNKTGFRYTPNNAVITVPELVYITYTIQEVPFPADYKITNDAVTKGSAVVLVMPPVKPFLQAQPDYAVGTTCDRIIVDVMDNDCFPSPSTEPPIITELFLMSGSTPVKSMITATGTAKVVTSGGKEVIHFYPKKAGDVLLTYRIQTANDNFSDSTLHLSVLEGCCCCEDYIRTVPCHKEVTLDILGDAFKGKEKFTFSLLKAPPVPIKDKAIIILGKPSMLLSGDENTSKFTREEKIDTAEYFMGIVDETKVEFWTRNDYSGPVNVPFRVDFYDGLMFCEGWIRLTIDCDCCECEITRVVKSTATLQITDLLSEQELDDNYRLYFFDEKLGVVSNDFSQTIDGQGVTIMDQGKTRSLRTKLMLTLTDGYTGTLVIPMVKAIRESDNLFKYCHLNLRVVVDCACPCVHKYSRTNNISPIFNDILTDEELQSGMQLLFKVNGVPSTNPPAGVSGVRNLGLYPVSRTIGGVTLTFPNAGFACTINSGYVGETGWEFYKVMPGDPFSIVDECTLKLTVTPGRFNGGFKVPDLVLMDPVFFGDKVVADTNVFLTDMAARFEDVTYVADVKAGNQDAALASDYKATLDQLFGAIRAETNAVKKAAYTELYTTVSASLVTIANDQTNTKAGSPLLSLINTSATEVNGFVKAGALSGTSESLNLLKGITISPTNSTLLTSFSKFSLSK